MENFHESVFPDERFHDGIPGVLVRPITCVGTYTRMAKDRTENLVVFTRLVASSPLPGTGLPPPPNRP
ncbi:hypothetical protein ACFY5H_33145 [Streptomyces sp. NPDC013012]|uniref:hypothetical protein n=1 Tax=Streptomyces sp. NPDC013012 TaxID=3364860 RepID=UPI00368EC670